MIINQTLSDLDIYVPLSWQVVNYVNLESAIWKSSEKENDND